MNNSQFSKLVSDTPKQAQQNGTPMHSTMQRATPSVSALGSRLRSSIPMTPYDNQAFKVVNVSLMLTPAQKIGRRGIWK